MSEKNITSKNERKLREILYHSPKIDKKKSGELTGYASIDQPWLQYYKQNAEKIEIPKKSLYQTLVDNNQDNLNGLAFICADRDSKEITFNQFIKDIDSMAKSLKALGLKERDEVVASFKNSYEATTFVFAKSRLGLIAHMIDPTNSHAEKRRMITETKAQYCFVPEDLLDTAESMSQEGQIKNIIIFPSQTSEHTETDLTTNKKYMSFEQFKENGKNIEQSEPYTTTKEEVSTIMYTGGSTGRSKGVMLTDHNFIAKYYRQINSNWKWGRNRKCLSCLPDVIAFGLSESKVSPLLAGETCVIIDCYKGLGNAAEYILKYKPQDWPCSPIHMEFFVNSPLISQETDLSHIEMIPCGGDGMKKQADINTRQFLENHGAKDAFAQGCGFTESTGAFCYGLGEENQPGYMGIPLAGNIQGVFDPETGEELKYNEVGEWAVLTDTAMLGYFGSASEQTQKALKVHADGQTWLHPGDMVHINEQGQTAMHDRTSRTFNYMGMKIYPSAIETFMSTHPAIKKCILSGINAQLGTTIAITNQKVPIVNVAIKDEFKGQEEVVMNEVEAIIKENAQSYVDIYAYIFRNELPYTQRGKIDYQQLEADGISEKEDRKVFIKRLTN